MDRLADWILGRMAAYRLGGVPYKEAARYTWGELAAAYKGFLWKGGKPVPAPDIPEREAAARARRVLRDIQGAYEEEQGTG
jgi:hypothetical protein